VNLSFSTTSATRCSNPHLTAEVLLPSTEAYNRGRKFEHYRNIESLREYLLISTERVSAELSPARRTAAGC
jgi:Uma2 family endonuclease